VHLPLKGKVDVAADLLRKRIGLCLAVDPWLILNDVEVRSTFRLLSDEVDLLWVEEGLRWAAREQI